MTVRMFLNADPAWSSSEHGLYKEIDDFGSRLMFQPWRQLGELVLDQSGEDKRQQELNSLALFPMGIFPRQASDSDV